MTISVAFFHLFRDGLLRLQLAHLSVDIWHWLHSVSKHQRKLIQQDNSKKYLPGE